MAGWRSATKAAACPAAPSTSCAASPIPPVLDNKRLGGLLTLIRQSQQTEPPGMRTSNGPKPRNQSKHMFSVG